MKTLNKLLLGLLFSLIPATCFAQGGGQFGGGANGAGVTITTVAGLNGISSKVRGTIAVVTDGATANDCTTGAGSTVVVCQYSGSTWRQMPAASAGATSFAAVTGATNTAALLMGTGGSLGTSGSGTIAATSLETKTWEAPGTIGSTTPNTGAFSTVSLTGQLTSTLATGTAPFVVASTTPVANLSIGGNAATATSATSATSATTATSATNALGLTFGSTSIPLSATAPTANQCLSADASATHIIWVTCGSGSSGISGMTAGQIPVAATATTVTSSLPMAGGGTQVMEGTIGSNPTNGLDILGLNSSGVLVNETPGMTGTAQSGTTYTVQTADVDNTIPIGNSSGITVTLPIAGTCANGSGAPCSSGGSAFSQHPYFTFINNNATATATLQSQSLSAPSAPTVGQQAGGALGAATYLTMVVYNNPQGGTLPSSATSFAASANNVIVVTSPAASGNATTYDVYSTTGAAGTETKQTTTPVNIGTNWTEPTTGLIAGAALPASNTTNSVFIRGSVTTNTFILPPNSRATVAALDNIDWYVMPSYFPPASAAVLGTDANSQDIAASAHGMVLPRTCSDTSGSGTAQTCTTSPSFVPVKGDEIIYTTTTANSGALTLNVNSSSAAAVQKWLGTALVSGDIPANKPETLVYDGTNWQAMTIGNAPAGGGGSVNVNGSGVSSPNFNGSTPAAGTNFVNGTWQVSGSSVSVEIPFPSLDQIQNPLGSSSLAEPAGSTLTFTGTAPASSSTNGTAGVSVLSFTNEAGGATTGSATTAGAGASTSWQCGGTGGAGSGGTNAIGGAGGGCTFTAGNGGASGGTAINSNGGGITFNTGSAGTGGSGTAGVTGVFSVNNGGTTVLSMGGGAGTTLSAENNKSVTISTVGGGTIFLVPASGNTATVSLNGGGAFDVFGGNNNTANPFVVKTGAAASTGLCEQLQNSSGVSGFSINCQSSAQNAVITKYGNNTLVGNGFAGELGKVNQTATGAAVTTTNILASTPAAGAYTVRYNLRQIASGSGGTCNTASSVVVTLGWTDDGFGAQTKAETSLSLAATLAAGAYQSDTQNIHTTASSAITIAVAYTNGNCTTQPTYAFDAYVQGPF